MPSKWLDNLLRGELMDKKLYYVFGTIFIIASGFLYTIERAISYYSWVGQKMSITQTGEYYAFPQLPNLLTNIYIPIFVIISVICFVLGYRKK